MYVNTTHVLREARHLADLARRCFFHWGLEFPDAVVDGRCQFDVVIANPPYVGTQPNQAITVLYETAKCGDLYAWILELSLLTIAETGNIGVVVPLSLMFSQQFETLRAAILRRKGTMYFAAFDVRPASLFGSSEAPNSQRACICLLRGSTHDTKHVFTTNLLRWTTEERQLLFPSLRFAEVTPFATAVKFPKLGDPQLITFWQRMLTYSRTIGTTIYRPKKNQEPPLLHHLYVSGSGRYFLTAMPTAMRSTGLNVFSFTDSWIRDIAMVTLNSNIFYWLWCVLGDGFHVTSENTEAMVLPEVRKDDQEAFLLRDALLRATAECATYQNKKGERIPNYNFNKRMDILLAIDNFIVERIAPDLELPQAVFAEYKSNSLLQRLNFNMSIGPFVEDE